MSREDPAVYLDGAALWSRAPYVRALLRGMCVHAQDAEDVVQEVLAGAWRAMLAGRFRPLPSLPLDVAIERWLFGITWRQVGHYRGSAWARRVRVSPDPMGHPDAPVLLWPSPEGAAEAREVLRELGRIPLIYREALILFHVLNFDTAEIAELTGVQPRAVLARLHRGAELLARAVQRWRRRSCS